ncbi:hypothetical protein QBC37DRAFT_433960 [Rhypophila decipiens]|uniref:NACHT domain-containing protein n=1 Tax=Rhypophila decipiens TaxID=261697 RepID=A0AAN7B257_9PEZI|nr:hypothetical protein QBC37DRAFT_433960 [Rhypophila decipiens]
MPSLNLRKRLHQLRSSSPKTDLFEDRAGGSVDNARFSSSKTPNTSRDLTGLNSSNIAALDTNNVTHVIQPRTWRHPTTTNPVGLTLVYSPYDGVIKADMVFIHGLGGTCHMTWSKDRDIRFFWPGVFLPLEPELCQTRIFTYGYDADVKSGSRTSSSILTFAKKLLYDLKYHALADETGVLPIGQVPLIFVAHSMGGLIVKEAYICGQLDPDYSHIVEAVLAIVFLSTPHRGSNLAETLNRILRVSPLSTPKPYVNELIQGSFTIQKINEQFRHMAPKLNIVSFYETRPTTIIRGVKVMVLEKDSSVLGYPGEISHALDADHHTVCKYDSREDPKYVAVCNYLKSMIGTIVSRQPTSAISMETRGTAATAPELSPQELLELFGISEPCNVDYMFFRDRWTPGTCTWVFREPSFMKWIDGSSPFSNILWIYGVPGSGKSILSSYLIDHLAQNGRACQYFFFRHADSRKRSLPALLKSLAFQITQSDPVFLNAIAAVSTNLALEGADPMTMWHRNFRTILFAQTRLDHLYWVFDGFDECDDIRTGVKLLTEVLNLPVSIKILITSRWDPGLDAVFKKLAPTHGELIEPITMGSNTEDCQRIVELELDWREIPDFRQRISSQLLAQAEGNFLWTRLTVERINKCHTTAAVEQALQELHPGMEDVYIQMAANIFDLGPADATLAKSILSWTCCAQRRLSLLELAEALAPQSRDILDLERSIVPLCGGFVVLDNDGSVGMVHQTARDFLVDSMNKTFHVVMKQSHHTVALRCLKLLSTPGIRRKLRLGQTPVLLGYASQYLWAHLASCDFSSDGIVHGVSKFLKGQHVLTWIQSLAQDRELHVMVQASEYMSMCARRLNAPEQASEQQILLGWAADMRKVVGKFGRQLLCQPDSIHTTILAFFPINSMIHKQQAHSGKQAITVRGIEQDWDDSVARLSFSTEFDAVMVVSGGGIVALAGILPDNTGRICCNIDSASLGAINVLPDDRIMIYRVDTHEEVRQLEHGEKIRKIQLDQFGTILVSCGYSTTMVWSLETGDCIAQARNPPTKPHPQTIFFDSEKKRILIGTNDRRLWSIQLDPSSNKDVPGTTYTQVTRIMEQAGTNSPSCMALSPDRQLIACGYRQPNKGITVWDLESQEQIAWRPDLSQARQLVWHPHNGELFGLMQVQCGQIFKWYPDDDQEPIIQDTEASCLAISDNGSVLAVGDQHGIVRLMRTEDMVIVARVVGQDGVLGLTFSSNCRQLYDLRRTHMNVWQPSALLRMAEPIPTIADLENDWDSPTGGSLNNTQEVMEEPGSAPRVDPITALSSRPIGTLFCVGTARGVVTLHKAASPLEVTLELHRSVSYHSIEQIAWSNDGSRVCYADVSRTIRVDSIALEDNVLTANRLAQMTIPQLRDNITQVLFHCSDLDRLLVASMITAAVVNLAENMIEAITTAEHTCAGNAGAINNDGPSNFTRWLPHPYSDGLVMKASATEIDVLSWVALGRVSPKAVIDISTTPLAPPLSSDPALSLAPIPGFKTTQVFTGIYKSSLDVLISPPRHNAYFLLTFSPRDSSRELTLHLWRLEQAQISTQTDANLTVTEVAVPAQVVTSMTRPLGFLTVACSKPQPAWYRAGTQTDTLLLVFLDRTNSMCTWSVPLDNAAYQSSHTTSTIPSSTLHNVVATSASSGTAPTPTALSVPQQKPEEDDINPNQRRKSSFLDWPGRQRQTLPPTKDIIRQNYTLPGEWVSSDTTGLIRLFPSPNKLDGPVHGRTKE